MMTSRQPVWVWREVFWSRPLEESTAIEAIRRLADDPAGLPLILEVRARATSTSFYLGCDRNHLSRLTGMLGASISAEDIERRAAVSAARTLHVSTPVQAFALDDLGISAASILTALHRVHGDEELVIQLTLGRRMTARTPPTSNDSPRSVGELLGGNRPSRRDIDATKATRLKSSQPGFMAAVRLGVVAADSSRRQTLMLGLLGAIRRLETAGVRLGWRPEHPAKLNYPFRPLPLFGAVKLAVREVAALAVLPVGETELAGLPPLHPKLLAPVLPLPRPSRDRYFLGTPTAPGVGGAVSISTNGLLRHIHTAGPTGSGKTWFNAGLFVEYVNRGNGGILIEPIGTLARAVVERIHPAHHHRVVYVDVRSETPIGFNPFASVDFSKGSIRPPELVADGVLSIFHDIFGENSLGKRTRDVIHSSILTILHHPDATLTMLPFLLTSPAFRRDLVERVAGDFVLADFWRTYERETEASKAQIIAPVLTRLRQVLLRSTMRNLLGQAHPKFNIREVFGAEKKIFIMALPEAAMGQMGGELYGSLMLHEIWGAIKERALIDPAKRHPVMVMIDEFTSYLRLESDFRDGLAMGRNMGAIFALAHQLLSQPSSAMFSAMMGNMRSHVFFQLAQEDANQMGRWYGEPTAKDFASLPAFNAYASIFENGANQPFMSMKTEPLGRAINSVQAMKRASDARYGIPTKDTEEALRQIVTQGAIDPDAPETNFGSRRKGSPS